MAKAAIKKRAGGKSAPKKTSKAPARLVKKAVTKSVSKKVSKPAAKSPAKSSAKPNLNKSAGAKPVSAGKMATAKGASGKVAAKVVGKPMPAKKPVVAVPAPVKASKGTKIGKPVAPPAVVPAMPIEKNIAKKSAPVVKKNKDTERKGIAIPAPVPTDMKPSKNVAGLKAAELEHYRDLLLAKRRELVGDMNSMEREALQRGGNSNLSNLPLHMADMGTDNYEQEFTLGLMEKDRNLLREINNALGKIQDGTYGICEGTQLPIGKPRLEAQPWAKYSIEHARKLEQRMGR